MKVTEEWLRKNKACPNGYAWYRQQEEQDLKKLVKLALMEGRHDWVFWAITHALNKKQCVQFAVFATETVLYIWDEYAPDSPAPRVAIQAAKAYLKRPCKETKEAVTAVCAEAAYATACCTAVVAKDAVGAKDAAYAAAVVAKDAIDGYAEASDANVEKIMQFGLNLLGAE